MVVCGRKISGAVLTLIAFVGFATPLLRGGVALCASNPNNLILNCGFESGTFSNWSILGIRDDGTGGVPPSQIPASGIGVGTSGGGFFTIHFPSNSGDNAAAFGGSGQISQSIPVIPGNNYRVS